MNARELPLEPGHVELNKLHRRVLTAPAILDIAEQERFVSESVGLSFRAFANVVREFAVGAMDVYFGRTLAPDGTSYLWCRCDYYVRKERLHGDATGLQRGENGLCEETYI